MSRKTIKSALKNFGLTQKEAEIYIFLAKHGVLTGGEISKQTKTHRALIYRILKSLQKKGVVESTLESPVRFSSVPFEKILDEKIRIKQEEAISLEKAKNGLLDDWQRIYGTKLEPDVGKFVVIEGNRKISSRIAQMINETKSQLSATLTVPQLVRNEQFGVFDAIHSHPFKSKVNFHFITELSNQNLRAMKLLKTKLKSELNLKGRNLGSSFAMMPRMVIRDSEEVLFFISPKSEIFSTGLNETCICTNNPSLTQALTAIFRNLWLDSTDIENKIFEIETGKVSSKRTILKEKTTDYEKAFIQLKEHTSQLPALTSQLERIEDSLPKFVGRERELWQLEEAAEKALRRKGNTIIISGEAGIGKTRLTKELADYTKTQNFAVLDCHCSYEASMPLWPVRKLLRDLFNISKQDTAKSRRDKIRNMIAEAVPKFIQRITAIDSIIAGVSAVPTSFAEDKYKMDVEDLSFFDNADDITTISQFLAAFSERKPIVLIFDDLHLADSSTLRLFRDLANNICESRVFLVGTYRREALSRTAEEPNRPFLELIKGIKKGFTRQEIELKRLSSDESSLLVNNVLGKDNDLLAKRIHKETEGNPFFVIETLKFLINKKLLTRKGDIWKLARNLEDIEIPPTIHDAISRRIQILREEERDILDCASVAGEIFTSDLIENVTSLDRLRVLKKLNTIERKYQLIHSHDDKYRFDHAKVREVLYQDIALELRKEYHSLIGEYLETTFKGKLGDVLCELAHHYYMSGNVQKGVPYLLEAGRRSSKEYAIFETIRYFSQALNLMKHDEKWSKKRSEILKTLGDLYGIMAEHELANNCYEKGIAETADEALRNRLRRRIRKKMIVENNGAKIAYYVCGEGEPTMFFLPSVGFTEVFNPQINYFSQKCKVVTMDPRGTGGSDKPHGKYTVDLHVGDLRSVIENLGEERIILIGFSVGGIVGIKYVANHPGRILKLVLWATNPQPSDSKGKQSIFLQKAKENPSWGVRKFWEAIFRYPGSEHLIEWGLKSAQKTTPEIFVNNLMNSWREDVSTLLEKIMVPTLILVGRKCSIPHEKIELLNSKISGSTLHIFEITEDSIGGTFPNVFKGNKYNRILEKFIFTK